MDEYAPTQWRLFHGLLLGAPRDSTTFRQIPCSTPSLSLCDQSPLTADSDCVEHLAVVGGVVGTWPIVLGAPVGLRGACGGQVALIHSIQICIQCETVYHYFYSFLY
jgi:hypothetical protein